MIKRESKFGTIFRHWFKANRNKFGDKCHFELKQTIGHSISFKCIENHQINYALALSSDTGVLMRIMGTNGEPDFSFNRKADTYIVIRYYGCFVVILIPDFLNEMKMSKRKSLTRKRAIEISAFYQSL